MTQQGDAVAGELATEKVGIKGYLAFFLTIIFFSGVFYGVYIVHFAAPAKYPDRGINRARWKYIFSFYGLWTP